MGARRKRGGASVSTLNRELSFARAVFNDFLEALEDRKQSPIANPVRSRLIVTEPAGRVRYLTDEEEQRLLAELPSAVDSWAVLVAIHTGLDRGAQFGLPRSDVDLATRTVLRRRSGTDPLAAVAVIHSALRA